MHLKFGHNLMFTKKYGITSLNVMQKHIFIFSTHVEEYKPHVKNSNSRNYHRKNDITRKIVISKENKKKESSNLEFIQVRNTKYKF